MSDGKIERAENALLAVIENTSKNSDLSAEEMNALAAVATAFAELGKI
ncbi:MAG: hypothetical protein AAGU32_04245 [Bacillota bacterium]